MLNRPEMILDLALMMTMIFRTIQKTIESASPILPVMLTVFINSKQTTEDCLMNLISSLPVKIKLQKNTKQPLSLRLIRKTIRILSTTELSHRNMRLLLP